MEALTDALLVNLPALLEPIIGSILSLIGVLLAGWIFRLIKTEKAQEIVQKLQANKEIVGVVVDYIESVGKDWNSQEKFDEAKKRSLEQINEKGIKVNEKELDALIESSVLKLKDSFKEQWNEEKEHARELTEKEIENMDDRK